MKLYHGAVGIVIVSLLTIIFWGYPAWREASDNGGQQAATPFNIAGNLYYVGANDVTAFLLVADTGHVLIDGGYPGTAKMILASVRELGYSPSDIRWLLNTHAHLDHAGGLAEIQKHTGAPVLAPKESAGILRRGGQSDKMLGPLSFLTHLPFLQYPPVADVKEIADQGPIHLGSHQLRAISTPGHMPGCTSWFFEVPDQGIPRKVVLSCGLSPPLLLSMFNDEATLAAFDITFQRLEALDVDIFLTPHARTFGRWKKYQQNQLSPDGQNVFVDPRGWKDYLEMSRSRIAAASGG